MRRITITFDNDKGFAVTESGRTAERLGWDEMLGQIAQLTHPKINAPHYRMLTPAEQEAYGDRHNIPQEDRDKFDENGFPT